MNAFSIDRAGAREVILMYNPYTLTATFRHRIHLRMAEWHLAISMLICGIVLLSKGETFAMDPYVSIRGMASEEVWGWILLVIGALRVIVLTINGTLPRGSPHLRATLSAFSAVIWSILFSGYLASDVPSLMIAITGVAILTEFVNIIRAAGSARLEDDKIKGRKNGYSS